MRLRIPCIKIQDVPAAVWFGFVRWRIFLSERSERANPLSFEVQPKSVVDRVAGFVTQNAHALNVRSTFDFAHEFSFKLHQARMREIKRNRKSRHAVRRKPFGRQPDVRFEANATIVQLAVKTFDMRLDE